LRSASMKSSPTQRHGVSLNPTRDRNAHIRSSH
jgi:hypothetical protein